MRTCVVCERWSSRRVCDTCMEHLTPTVTEESEPELVAETVMAQRLWRWLPGEGLRGMRKTWESGFMEASCIRGHPAPHWTPAAYDQYTFTGRGIISTTTYRQRPVDPLCLCGVNAYKLTRLFDSADLSWAQGVEYRSMFAVASTDALPVLGIVELGGEVHEYDYGYRAQYARIVEGTVLTSLPIDQSALTELEERYDAPFRVQSYDDWKIEWEATYGRDREAEEKDQSSETGEGSGHSGTVQGARSLQVQLTANTAALQAAFATAHHTTSAFFDEVQPESWWERYKRSWRDDWRLSKHIIALRIVANLLIGVGVAMLTAGIADLAGLL